MLEQGFRNLRVSGARFHWRRRLSLSMGLLLNPPSGFRDRPFGIR